jgi:hypothetical protein
MLRHISLLGLIIFVVACEKLNKKSCPYKNQDCSNALFTLINRTQDTIFYGIGSNMWEDTLFPGQQRSLQYGRVKVTYDNSCKENKVSWSTHQLSSNFGSWGFNIDNCNKKSAFEYDANRGIKLYDVTEY